MLLVGQKCHGVVPNAETTGYKNVGEEAIEGCCPGRECATERRLLRSMLGMPYQHRPRPQLAHPFA